jgi:tetratricopeptide (TPR) repeat protein
MSTAGGNSMHGLFAAALALAAAAGCTSLGGRGREAQSATLARQLTEQGVAAMERGDWLRAESLLERAVSTVPSDTEARRNYAETLWHRGAAPEAIVHLEEACRRAGDDPALWVRTGEVHLALGRLDEASRLADKALRADSRFAPAWALHGRVAAAAGKPRAALADYQRALGFAPDSFETAILVAEAYRQLNEPQQALVALQALADRHAPGDEPTQVLHLQGWALVALARYDDAVGALSRAAERERPTPDLLCDLANAQLLAGRPAQAQRALDGALALDPNHAPSRALTARLATANRGSVQ